MVSRKVKENTFGQLEQFTKAISRMVTNMDLENGKKEWEMAPISTKANMYKTNVAGMELSIGV